MTIDALISGKALETVSRPARNIPPFVDEDNKISEMQQVGVRSRQATSGRFSKHEGLAWKFDAWVVDRAYNATPAADTNGNHA